MNADDFKYAPRGYVSDRSKQQFTLITGILGAVFFLLQMAIPFALMILLMPGFFLMGGWEFSEMQAEKAVAWNGEMWYITRQTGNALRESGHFALWSLGAGEKGENRQRGRLPVDSPWLLADRDRIWIIGSDGVLFFKGGTLEGPVHTTRLGAVSRPFLYRDRPAVVERDPEGYALRVLEGDEWRKEGPLDLGFPEEFPSPGLDIQVVARGERLDFFRKIDDTVYHRPGVPDGRTGEAVWKPVAHTSSSWTAVALGETPALFLRGDPRDFSAKISGLRFTGAEWQPFFEHRLPSMTMTMGAAGETTDRFALLVQGFPGSLRVIDVAGGRATGERKFGSGFPFGGGFMTIMMAPQFMNFLFPLLLAVILAALMRRHRVCEYGEGDRKVPFASLTRRAIAQLIDTALTLAPMAAGFVAVFSRFEDMTSPFEMMAGMGLVFLGFLWAALLFFAFSFTEGRWGGSPGKWICGIRVVGTDLAPCGFGRALLRNLLKFADGFFNFLVGILVSALSENWQRVGDMAARTVVIRALPGRPTGPRKDDEPFVWDEKEGLYRVDRGR